MWSQNKIVYLLLSLGVVLFSAMSPPVASAERLVTLEQAYRSAIIRSESIAIAREELIQSEEEVSRMRSFFYPKIKANLNYLQRSDSLNSSTGFTIRSKSNRDLKITLAQPIYSGGRAMATYRSAKLGRTGEVLHLALTKEDLLFAIAAAYYDALKVKNNVEIELKEVERLTGHRRNAEKRLQVGEATKTVLLRAEAALSDAQAKLIRVQNDEMEAKDHLALLARIEGIFRVENPSPVLLPDRLKLEWLSVAHKNRIDIKREKINIDQARAGIQLARGNFLPSLSLELQYLNVDQDPEGSFLIKEDKTAILKLEVPLFEGMLRTSELAQARSRLRQSILLKKQRQDEIDTRVRSALLERSALTGELKHLKDQVRFAKEAFLLASRQFAVGLGTNLEVLDANAALLNAERRYSNTIYDREMAMLQIKKESGLFSPLGSDSSRSGVSH